MIIEKITLNNFKSHKATQINFNKGITLILGENGAGKTTILEAISYALFKETNTKLENLIRKPQNPREQIQTMQVILEFSHNGTTYQIKRGKKASQNIAELRFKENDKFIIRSKGDKNITQDIEKILEIDSKSFLNAVYIRQGEITDLIDKTPSHRKEFISKLLNIESLQEAWDEIRIIIEDYKEQENNNNGRLSKYNDILKEDKEILENIKNNKNKIESHKKEKEQLKTQQKELETQDNKNKEIKEEYERLENNIQQQEKYIEQLNQQKERYETQLKTITENEKEIEKITKEIKPLPKLKEANEIKQEIDSHKKDLINIEKNIKEINDNKIKIENTKEDSEKYKELTDKQEELEEELKKLKDQENENNKIEYDIENITKQKDVLFKRINKTVDQSNKIFNKNFRSSEEIEQEIDNEKEKTEYYISGTENTKKENETKLAYQKTKIENTKEILDKIKETDTCPICKSTITHKTHEQLTTEYTYTIQSCEDRIEEINKAEKNNDKKLEELKEYKKQIESINIEQLIIDFNEFTQMVNKLKELKGKEPQINEVRDKIKELNNRIENNKTQINNLADNYKAYEYATNRLNELPDIDIKLEEQEEINNKINKKKIQIREIFKTTGIKDNIKIKIEYLETQEKMLNKLQGIISNKENIIEENKNNLDKIQQETNNLTNMNTQIKKLNYDKQEHEKINNEYTSCTNKINEITSNIIKEETELDKDKQQHEKIIKEIKELDEIKEKQEHIKDYIKLLEQIREVYSKDGVQKDLRNAIRPQIEKETLKIFNEFSFEYSSIKLDEDYDLTVQTKQEDLALNMLSGGERIVIALALRLGIAKIITKNKTELLILDEPTIHLDAERRSYLIDIIRKINIVPQMLVVTHDDEMESLSNNIIKINKTSGISAYEK